MIGYDELLRLAASAEREGMRVRDIYQTYLGRTPGESEVDYWVGQFLHGSRAEEIAAGFLASAEYFTSPQKGHSAEIPWLRSVYQQVLRRDPGDAELAYWLTVLK